MGSGASSSAVAVNDGLEGLGGGGYKGLSAMQSQARQAKTIRWAPDGVTKPVAKTWGPVSRCRQRPKQKAGDFRLTDAHNSTILILLVQ